MSPEIICEKGRHVNCIHAKMATRRGASSSSRHKGAAVAAKKKAR